MADINLLKKLVDDDSNKDELAFKVNKDNYVSIQTCSDGYDYSIYGSDYRVLDGGIYDDPDVSIFEALKYLFLKHLIMCVKIILKRIVSMKLLIMMSL